MSETVWPGEEVTEDSWPGEVVDTLPAPSFRSSLHPAQQMTEDRWPGVVVDDPREKLPANAADATVLQRLYQPVVSFGTGAARSVAGTLETLGYLSHLTGNIDPEFAAQDEETKRRDLEGNPIYALGQRMKKHADETRIVHPDLTTTQKWGELTGQLAGDIAGTGKVSGVLKAAGLGATGRRLAAPAIQFAGQGGATGLEAGTEAGANEKELLQSFLAQAGIGAGTSVVGPYGKWIERLNSATGGGFKSILQKAATALVEGGSNAAQEVLENGLAAYADKQILNKDHDLYAELIDSARTGGVMGFAASLAISALGGRSGQIPIATEAAPADRPGPPIEGNAEVARFRPEGVPELQLPTGLSEAMRRFVSEPDERQPELTELEPRQDPAFTPPRVSREASAQEVMEEWRALKAQEEYNRSAEFRQAQRERAAELERQRPSGLVTIEPPPERILTEEDLARAEYESGLASEAQEWQAEHGDELLAAVMDSGGMPAMASPYFSAEIEPLIEEARNPMRQERIQYNRLFSKDAPDMDELATRLRDRGFNFITGDDVKQAVQDRIRTGKKVYGLAEAQYSRQEPPRLRAKERQGDLLSTQTEDLRLVGEKGVDHEARQRAADRAEREQIDAKRLQDEQQQTLFRRQEEPGDYDVEPWYGDAAEIRGPKEQAQIGPSPQTSAPPVRDRLATQAVQRDSFVKENQRTLASAIRAKATDANLATLPSVEAREFARAELNRIADDIEEGTAPPNSATKPRLPVYRRATTPALREGATFARDMAVDAQLETGITERDVIFKRGVEQQGTDKPYSLPNEVRAAVGPTTDLAQSAALARFAKILENDPHRIARGERRPPQLQAVAWPAGVPASGLKQIRLAHQFARANGQEIVFFKDHGDERINAAVPSKDRRFIFLNIDAKRDPVHEIVAHELTHQLERQAPEIYHEYAKAVIEAAGNRGVYDATRTRRGYKGYELDQELVADFTAEAIRNPARMVRLMGDKPTVLQRILGALQDIIERLVRAVRQRKNVQATDAITNLRAAYRAMETAWEQLHSSRARQDQASPTQSVRPEQSAPVEGEAFPTPQPSFHRQEVPGEQSPEDDPLFRGPVITGRIQRFFYEGARDVFERTPGLKRLGEAVRLHVDQARKYDGELIAPYRLWEKKHGRAERKQALKDFEAYWGERERNPQSAAKNLALTGPASQELVELWRQSARFCDERNKGMSVFDDELGYYRPIGTIRDYFPRMPKASLFKILDHGIKDQAEWKLIADALKEEGKIQDESEAVDYLKRALKPERRFDYLGNIEKARKLPLPNKLYDYSFATARRYMQAWAERKAQVEAFGQKLGPRGKDFFDIVRDKVIDRSTSEYIKAVQDRAYGVVPSNLPHRAAAFMNTLVTPMYLGNAKTMERNIISGFAHNVTTFGLRPALRAALDVKKAWHSIDDAYAKGVLHDDLMHMVSDAEQLNSRPLAKLQRGSSRFMSAIGYKFLEDVTRAHGMLTAKSLLRQAINSYQKNPNSRGSLQYRAFMKRNGHSLPTLVEENMEGPQTDRYLREAVNLAQGGYRYDQVPLFTDSPLGRFLFKFQKWGTMATRNMVKNAIAPMAGTELKIKQANGKIETVNVRSFTPATRYLITTAMVGQAILGLEEWLFGTTPGFASVDEIIKTWDENKQRALMLALDRAWKGMIAVGGLGIIANYAQHLMDASERRSPKSPYEPPALGIAKGLYELILSAKEQRSLTGRDLEDFMRSQVSIFRTSKAMLGRALPDLLPVEKSDQELRWLNSVTRRYSNEIGAASNTRGAFGKGKTQLTPFQEDLRDALMTGDTATAKALLKDQLSGLPPSAREAFLESLKAQIRARQPIRVGGIAGAERRVLFLEWAKRRLSPEEMERIKALDKTYRDTARSAGLMSVTTKPVDLNKAIREMKIRQFLQGKNR